MGHWQHRCTGCILDAWVREARRARAEREEALRALLLRKGALLSARYARGWFGARRQRAAQRRCAAARASLLGAAWRGWLRLIEARRRREDLEWLFGPAMGGLEAQLESKYELRKGGRLGPGATDQKELTVLNRILRYTDQGYEYEADPRQAEKLLESLHLGSGCNGAATAGIKALIEQLEKDQPVPSGEHTEF